MFSDQLPAPLSCVYVWEPFNGLFGFLWKFNDNDCPFLMLFLAHFPLLLHFWICKQQDFVVDRKDSLQWWHGSSVMVKFIQRKHFHYNRYDFELIYICDCSRASLLKTGIIRLYTMMMLSGFWNRERHPARKFLTKHNKMI